MAIIALQWISFSELIRGYPSLTTEWIEKNPDEFKEILYGLGVDTSSPIEHQKSVQHRNRFNATVICDRWVGNERVDKQWLDLGYASKEAKDKASKNSLLEDIYKQKRLTDE